MSFRWEIMKREKKKGGARERKKGKLKGKW
jgi:hypothetical protein